MDREKQCWDFAPVERGIVTGVENDGTYTVKSYGRDGLTVTGLPPLVSEDSYNVDDKVYFFVFNDGRGAIMGIFS